MKEIYTDYARYNLWANRRMVAMFAHIDEEMANRHIESSFPSVKRTLMHIWDAEIIWLSRLEKLTIKEFPSKNFTGSFAEACQDWLATSEKFLAHVEGLSEADFSEEMTFSTITSGAYTQVVFEMIHHCMNHSTYHRGQLVTFARQLGMRDLPSTDMIFYIREKGKESAHG